VDSIPLLLFLGGAALAVAGYLITHWLEVRLEQRRARLELVNRQLGELYGPLFALVAGSRQAWGAFRKRYRPEQKFWTGDPSPTDEEAAAWRLWMREVFMPINLRVEDVIVGKADLLDETEMPMPFLQLVAHVAAYKTVIKRWDQADFTENIALVAFPRSDLLPLVQKRFAMLKEEQQALLGELRP